jgi:hypothetical protein
MNEPVSWPSPGLPFLRSSRLTTSVQLIAALGGGWEQGQLEQVDSDSEALP